MNALNFKPIWTKQNKMLAKLHRGYQISLTGRKTCVPSFLAQDKGGCFCVPFKKKFFKMNLFCCSSTLSSRRRVCKILVFPSVLPMFRKLTKIGGGGYQINYQSKLLKKKKGICVLQYLLNRGNDWQRTIQCSCDNIHVTYRIWFLYVYCIHKEIQSITCHHWTNFLHSCNEVMG